MICSATKVIKLILIDIIKCSGITIIAIIAIIAIALGFILGYGILFIFYLLEYKITRYILCSILTLSTLIYLTRCIYYYIKLKCKESLL